MLTSIQVLDLLKAHFGSDYRTAKELQVVQSRISRIRNEGGILNDEQAVKAAQILGLKEEFVLLSITAERSKATPLFPILQKIADKFAPKNAAAAVFLSVIAFGTFLAPYIPTIA
jgi:hypothetical protein